MYFSYGFPRALATGVAGHQEECLYCSHASPEYVVLVFSSAVQVWSGSQHRAKLGEARRGGEALAEEGPYLRAHWCPQKRVLAAVTSRSLLHLYSLNVSSEPLWRLPGGGELRRVNLFLSHSQHLDYGAVRVADLGGDARSLLVALSNGTMQVFSWQGQLRGQANPFTAAYEGSRSRRQASRAASLALGGGAAAAASLPSPFATSPSDDGLAGPGGSSASLPRDSSSAALEAELSSGGLGLLAGADSLLLPTPAQPADVAVARMHYAPAARMLAAVLRDGRCVLCRTADAGVHPAEALQLFRWVYRPAGPDAPAAVAAALNPTAQLLAVGLSHGRVAVYTLQALLAARQPRRDSGGGGGGGAPEPARLLSLSEWGFRSAVVGPAAQLRWSPDGRVLAVGYAGRGLAVWTPSGCRLMCTLRQAAAAAPPAAAAAPAGGAGPAAADGSGGQQPRRASVEGGGLGWSPGGGAGPLPAGEAGVLEGACSALAWSADGYQLLAAEAARPGCLHQLEFARHVAGSHRVLHTAAAAAAGGGGSGAGPAPDEVHVLQAADRILLVTEARQGGDPSLRPPPAAAASAEAAEGEGGGGRRDLGVQHVKLPQQYLDAAYPLLHAAVSQDCGDVAVAGTCGLALYSRRARRWRLFGDATQERALQVRRLLWLPSGVVAAVAQVEAGRGGKEAAPQLLLYPQYHLDNASLLARVPLKQVPVAVDAVGWHLLLAFAPLEVRLYRVVVEGALGPQGQPTARLDLLRDLSILGLANPLQEIALVDPASLAPPADTPATASSASSSAQLQQQQQEAGQAAAEGGDAAGDADWPRLTVTTRPRTPSAGAAAAQAEGLAEAPQLCVLLRAGGIMSRLDLQEGTEALLSDAIERFWLPISAAAAAGHAAAPPPTAAQALPRGGSGSGASLEASASDAELSAGGGAASAPGGFHAASQARGPPPRVEMPWWCYGPRGMQLWFPSALSDPLTPSLRALSLASPTRTGLSAAAAAAATNSTDPELEFDREVYPIGVSLAEVSIVGVVQRVVRSQAFPPSAPQSLCLHPLPESQPVLPCLLRRLLQRGRADDALALARWHSGGPHFNRSLEWLLFTSLELDAEQRPASTAAAPEGSPGGGGGRRPRFNSSYGVTVGAAPPRPLLGGGGQAPAAAGPLLLAAARLLAAFPQFAEVVVSVARKTDATLWPALFAAVGSPARMCLGLLQAEKLQSAACCLVIVERIEGRAQAQAQALQLIQSALGAGQYGLASDLLRFLVPPGEAELAAELALEAQQRAAAAQTGQAQASRPRRRQEASHGEEQFEGGEQEQRGASGEAAGQLEGKEAQHAQQAQQAQQAGSWFWGLFGGGGSSEPAAAPQPADLPEQQQVQQAQQPTDEQAEQQEEGGGAAGEAWRLTAAHAWRLLDSGALREAAQLARALSDLHGGLASLLRATAAEAPEAAAQLAPSAAAAASALFVASNEFAAADRDAEQALAARQLLAVCQDAGCVNLAAALALLLGEGGALHQLAAAHPGVWSDLHSLVANDVHLCGYAPVLSPLPSPVVASPAAALLGGGP